MHRIFPICTQTFSREETYHYFKSTDGNVFSLTHGDKYTLREWVPSLVNSALSSGDGAHLCSFVHTSPMMIIIPLNNVGGKNA